jgi:hypothetical protein
LAAELKHIVPELKPDEVTWPVGAAWAIPERMTFVIRELSLGSPPALLESERNKPSSEGEEPK